MLLVNISIEVNSVNRDQTAPTSKNVCLLVYISAEVNSVNPDQTAPTGAV